MLQEDLDHWSDDNDHDDDDDDENDDTLFCEDENLNIFGVYYPPNNSAEDDLFLYQQFSQITENIDMTRVGHIDRQHGYWIGQDMRELIDNKRCAH